jgi:hypothetical protein
MIGYALYVQYTGCSQTTTKWSLTFVWIVKLIQLYSYRVEQISLW